MSVSLDPALDGCTKAPKHSLTRSLTHSLTNPPTHLPLVAFAPVSLCLLERILKLLLVAIRLKLDLVGGVPLEVALSLLALPHEVAHGLT